MVIFVGKFFGNMVISITTHWSFWLYGPFLAGPDVDHIFGIDCTSRKPMKLSPVMVETTLKSSIGSKSVWSVGRNHTNEDTSLKVICDRNLRKGAKLNSS